MNRIWHSKVAREFALLGKTLIRPTLLRRDQEAGFDPSIWQAICKSSLFSNSRDHDQLDLSELASAYYGLAQGSLDLPLVCTFAAHGVIARDLLVRFGTTAQKARYLPGLEDGSLCASICNSETGAGVDLRKIRSQCTITGGEAHLQFEKPLATNAFGGTLFFISAWEKLEHGEPKLAIYIVEAGEVQSANLVDDLCAFRTGLTGSVKGDIRDFPVHERRLGENALAVFKNCFHLERLFIGVIAAGVLSGLEAEARKVLEERSLKTGRPVDQQWLHGKLLDISCARVKICALVESILQYSSHGLEARNQELSVLKLLVNEEAFAAALAYLELAGHQAVGLDHIAQKQVRDFMAFRFFGGTSELQKISLYTELTTAKKITEPKRASLNEGDSL